MEECSRRLGRSRRSHVHRILFLFLAELWAISLTRVHGQSSMADYTTTSRSWWRRSQEAGVYSDYGIREMKWTELCQIWDIKNINETLVDASRVRFKFRWIDAILNDSDIFVCVNLVFQLFFFLANVNSSSCSLYVVVRPSVVCMSVCNVRAPYSGDWNFRNFFFTIWYAGHLLTSR